MKKSLSFWQFVGFVFTSLAGTLLHFAYEWSNQSLLFAPFSAVNESTWEHMKLLFFPMFVFALIQNRYWGKEYEDFWCIKLAGILLGLILIPVLYYTYTGALGVSADWFNITIFFLSAAASYAFETWLFNKEPKFCPSPATAFFLLCLIAVIFAILTFAPVHIPLFQDPITKLYGIIK